MNTVLTNTIPGASLADNQITLSAGKYYVETETFFHFHNVVGHVSVRLNINNEMFISTFSARLNGSASGSNGIFHFPIKRYIDLSYNKLITLQCITDQTQTLYGFGYAVNFTTEVYSDIRIWRIGEYEE